MNKNSYQQIHLFLTVLTFLVLFSSLYLQYFVGLHPCPLCIMQRLCVFLLFVLMGLSVGAVKKYNLIRSLQVLISSAGLFFSLRQLWLQSLPPGQIPACLPGLDILVKYYPLEKILNALLWGASDCAEVTWTMLGISIAGWSALFFLVMALTGVVLLFSPPRESNYWQ